MSELTMQPVTVNVSPSAILPSHLQIDRPGRFQAATGEITTIFDVAHTPQTCLNLARKIREHWENQLIHAVVAMPPHEKEIERSLDNLIPVVDCWYVGNLQGDRSSDALRLVKHLHQRSVPSVCAYTNVVTAYENAKNIALPGSIIVVFGSFLTVAAVMNIPKE